MEDWTPLSEFPGYSVSNHGRVRNDRTDRMLSIVANQFGIAYVGMVSGYGLKVKRSIAPLVAQAFLPPHRLKAFDTPINLDGDRLNNDVTNLMWRPLWFARRYHRQFYENDSLRIDSPVQELHSGDTFPTSLEAAVRYGLMMTDIFRGVIAGAPVWPTYQFFRKL